MFLHWIIQIVLNSLSPHNLLSLAWQERQRVIYDEQKKLAQHQAQTKSPMARYDDELARKRMQACSLNFLVFTEVILKSII